MAFSLVFKRKRLVWAEEPAHVQSQRVLRWAGASPAASGGIRSSAVRKRAAWVRSSLPGAGLIFGSTGTDVVARQCECTPSDSTVHSQGADSVNVTVCVLPRRRTGVLISEATPA